MRFQEKCIVFLLVLILATPVPLGRVPTWNSSVITVPQIAQDGLMVYRMIRPDVTLELVNQSADLFNVTGNAVLYEGVYYVNEGNNSFEMDVNTGSMWYADYSKLWNASYLPTLLTNEECKTIADAFLMDNGLMPNNTVFKDYGKYEVTTIDVETEETTTRTLYRSVEYHFEYGELFAVGPEYQISVMLGDEGEIIGFSWSWRDVEELGTFIEFDFQTALNISGVYGYRQEQHTLVYHADSDSDYLQPVYSTLIDAGTIENPHQFRRHVPATAFSPVVHVLSPTPFTECVERDSIFFNCSVQFGTSLYTFEWNSSIDGFMSEEMSFETSALSVGRRNETVLAHTITVTGIDANGLEAEAVVVVTVRDQFPLVMLFGIIAIVGFLSIIVVLSLRRSGKILALLILALLFVGFCIYPVSALMNTMTQRNAGVLPRIVMDDREYITSSNDDGTREVGIEWCTYPEEVTIRIPYYSFWPGGGFSIRWRTITLTIHDLPNCDDNAKGFYNKIGRYSGWTKVFDWGNYWAWERDFRDPSYLIDGFHGMDHFVVDDVDITFFSGHGNPTGFKFTREMDRLYFNCDNAKWGNKDLEWIILDACETLKTNAGGDSVFDRWRDAFDGLHMTFP